ncbi:hypothetical protein JCM8097_003882 [Rhodosporidiobolus ruineniae]
MLLPRVPLRQSHQSTPVAAMSSPSCTAPTSSRGTARASPSATTQSSSPPRPRPRGKPTHFVALPLTSSESLSPSARAQLDRALEELREAVVQLGLPEKAVRPVGTLHLTLGVCELRGKEEVERAKKALEELDVEGLLRSAAPTSLHAGDGTGANSPSLPPPLEVDLHSLFPIKGSPRASSCLSASPIDASSRLQPFAEAVRAELVEQGVLRREYERVRLEGGNGGERWEERERGFKLHATLVNTVYCMPRRGRGQTKPPKPANPSSPPTASSSSASSSRPPPPPAPPDPSPAPPVALSSRGTFDARRLLAFFASTTWASGLRVGEVQLCEMGARTVRDPTTGEVGEMYRVVGRRRLPG